MTIVNVTAPVITGTPDQGQTLFTSDGTWTSDDPLTFAYQWLRCDAAGANCVDILGATSPSYLLRSADVGSRIRSEVTATEVPPTPPPSGTAYDQFSDFDGYPTSRFFLNRLKPNSNDIFQNYAGTVPAGQTNWPSTGGVAIDEISTSHGAGFRFRCNPEMIDPGQGASVKRTEISGALIDHMVFSGGLGSTDHWTFSCMFPSSGNPSGFPGYARNNIIWQYHDNGVGRLPFILSLDMSAGPTNPKFAAVLLRYGGGEDVAFYSPFYVQMNTWYTHTLETTWSSSGTGHFNWYLDGVQRANYSGRTMLAGDSPYLQFGFYTVQTFNAANEVHFAELVHSVS